MADLNEDPHTALFERLRDDMCCMNANLIDEAEQAFIELGAIKQAAQDFVLAHIRLTSNNPKQVDLITSEDYEQAISIKESSFKYLVELVTN